jgi:hypothetical protein
VAVVEEVVAEAVVVHSVVEEDRRGAVVDLPGVEGVVALEAEADSRCILSMMFVEHHIVLYRSGSFHVLVT